MNDTGYCYKKGHGIYGGKERRCPWCRIEELEARLQYEKQDGDRYAERVGILEAEVERLRNLIEQHNAQEAVCHINMEKDDETV